MTNRIYILGAVLLAVVVLTSGCTIPNPFCQPSYTKIGPVSMLGIGMDCMTECRKRYKVTSFKTEKETIPFVGVGIEVCYCDLHNCNP